MKAMTAKNTMEHPEIDEDISTANNDGDRVFGNSEASPCGVQTCPPKHSSGPTTAGFFVEHAGKT